MCCLYHCSPGVQPTVYAVWQWPCSRYSVSAAANLKDMESISRPWPSMGKEVRNLVAAGCCARVQRIMH
jgi:hypothetical protein